MAAKKKKKKKKAFKAGRRTRTEAQLYADFLGALLSGVVHAVQLYEKRVNGVLEFEMDEEEDDE